MPATRPDKLPEHRCELYRSPITGLLALLQLPSGARPVEPLPKRRLTDPSRLRLCSRSAVGRRQPPHRHCHGPRVDSPERRGALARSIGEHRGRTLGRQSAASPQDVRSSSSPTNEGQRHLRSSARQSSTSALVRHLASIMSGMTPLCHSPARTLEGQASPGNALSGGATRCLRKRLKGRPGSATCGDR
jgi:hypothetical protein